VKSALIAPVAASTDLAVEVALTIWTARLRIDREAIFRASVSRVFKAAAATALAAEVDSAVIVSVAAADSAVIASAVEDLVVAALEDLAAGSGADDEDSAWNFPILFLEKLKP
jgi:hypothetical protein